MRRHILATLLVASAAVALPATASAGGFGLGSSSSSSSSMSSGSSGMGSRGSSGAASSSSSSSSRGSSSSASTGNFARVDRGNTWGIGSLRVMGGKSGMGIGLVSKDGSKVRGFFNVKANHEGTYGGNKISTESSLKVRGNTKEGNFVSVSNGKGGASTTTYGKTVSDKQESHSQVTSTSSDGRVAGHSVTTNTDGKVHETSYNHDSKSGTTVRATETKFASGATNASQVVERANGKVDRTYTATSADGKISEARGSSVTPAGQVRTFQTVENKDLGVKNTQGEAFHANGGPRSTYSVTTDTRTGDQARSFGAQAGNKSWDRSSSMTHEGGNTVFTKSEATRVVIPGGSGGAGGSAPRYAAPSGGSAPRYAAPSGGSSAASSPSGGSSASSGGSAGASAPKAAPVYVKSERVDVAPAQKALTTGPEQKAIAAAPAMKALPPGDSSLNNHVAGKEGGVSVKETYAKAAPGTYAARALTPSSGPQHAASDSNHAAGKEGGVSVKDTIAKAAPGGLTGKHSAPESGPKHAASE